MKNLFILMLLCSSCARLSHIHETPLTEDSSEFKICFIGDTGTDAPEQSLVAKKLESEKCNKIYILGDLIYPNGIKNIDDPQLENKFLKHYLPLTSKGLNPTITVLMGNHDYRNDPAVWIEVSKKYPSIIYPSLYFMEKIGSTCLVSLDSNLLRFFQKYGLATEQSNWLDSIDGYLKKNCKTKIALSHHPYLSSGKHHGNSTGITKLFYEQKILGKFDYLISGHEHILSDEGEKNGTRLLISGAAGNTDRGYKAGYILLKIKNGTSKYQIIEL